MDHRVGAGWSSVGGGRLARRLEPRFASPELERLFGRYEARLQVASLTAALPVLALVAAALALLHLLLPQPSLTLHALLPAALLGAAALTLLILLAVLLFAPANAAVPLPVSLVLLLLLSLATLLSLPLPFPSPLRQSVTPQLRSHSRSLRCSHHHSPHLLRPPIRTSLCLLLGLGVLVVELGAALVGVDWAGLGVVSGVSSWQWL